MRQQWRLEWKHESGEWRTQIQNDDRATFDAAVRNEVEVAEREGGWMCGAEWRIAEYELREVSTTAFILNGRVAMVVPERIELRKVEARL